MSDFDNGAWRVLSQAIDAQLAAGLATRETLSVIHRLASSAAIAPESLRLATRSHAMPVDILKRLVKSSDYLVRAAAIANPSLPADFVETAIAEETNIVHTLQRVAKTGGRTATGILARRTAGQMAFDFPDPAWFTVAKKLFANEQLDDSEGVRLLTAVLTRRPTRGASDLPGVQASAASWAAVHADLARPVVETTGNPNIAQAIATGPQAKAADIVRAITLCLPAATSMHERIDIAQSLLRSRAMTSKGRRLLTAALTGHPAELDHLGLFEGDKKAAEQQIWDMIQHSPHRDVFELLELETSDRRRFVARFIARKDVTTSVAVRALDAAHVTDASTAELLNWRPFDLNLPVEYLSAHPELWAAEPDLDILIEAMTMTADDGWGSGQLRLAAIADKLGVRIVDLPWRVVAGFSNSHVATTLSRVLASEEATIAFASISDDMPRASLRQLADIATAVCHN